MPENNNSHTLHEIQEMIGRVFSAEINDDAPIWLGVKGPKRHRKDEYSEIRAQNFVSLAPKSYKNLVLTPKAIS